MFMSGLLYYEPTTEAQNARGDGKHIMWSC